MIDRPIIGLAGGIASGKSTVAGLLEQAGCVVARSDETGRAALRDPEIRSELVGWWGEDILDAAGEVDRSAVASIVFKNPAELRRLEALTHPWIEARRREQFDAAVEAVAFVIDAPLLFEAGLDGECAATIFVDAPRRLRLQRVQEGRGWSPLELDRREDCQMPLDEKRRRADHVIENDGDLELLTARVARVLKDILQAAGP